MSERKQLELAAKAYGLTEFRWNKNKECMCHYNEQMKTWYQQGYGDLIEWRPDIDQSDSDRMGAKLRMNVDWNRCGVAIMSYSGETFYEYFADHNNDENSALMAARMRCAVAIGEGME